FATDLVFRAAPIRYLADLHVLAVPFQATSGPFAVNQVRSTLFTPVHSAPIRDAAWGLPVAELDPATLGDASGVGELLLWLDSGLSATWLGQSQAVDLGSAVLAVDGRQLTLTASQATGEHIQQTPKLANGGHDRVELQWQLT